jgi:hypothetical protein
MVSWASGRGFSLADLKSVVILELRIRTVLLDIQTVRT